MELTHVPPMLRDGLAGQKRKDRDEDAVDGITGAGDTWEGDLSGQETEPDEPMEEGDENGSLPASATHCLTAASRFTNQVSTQVPQSNT